MAERIDMDPANPIPDETFEAPSQALFLPLDGKRQMMVLMVVMEKGEDGDVTLSRPYLDDIEAAGLCISGRNWSLEGTKL